jgi:hypothetical protein
MALTGRPKNFPVRPVTGGVQTELPTTDMPREAWIEQNNYKTNEQNIERLGGLTQFSQPPQYTNVDRADLITYWETIHERVDKLLDFRDTVNSSEYIVLTELGVRRVTGDVGADSRFELINPRIDVTGIVSINQASEPWVVTVPTANITSQSTVDNAQTYTVIIGDLFYAEDSTGFIPIGRITSININGANSELSVEPGLTGVSLTGLLTTGQIQHIFQDTESNDYIPNRLQWTFLAEDGDNMIVITNNATSSTGDSGGYLLRQNGFDILFLELDGSPSVDIPSVPTVDIKAFRTCAYSNGRLFIANTIEEYSDAVGTLEQTYRRVRWSLIDSITDADAKFTFYPEHYVDLPQTTGQLLRLLTLSDLLIAYFTDGVYVGRPTNRPDLPVSFSKIETGGRGLVTDYAVTALEDNHFFVSNDDVYVLAANLGLSRINFPAVDETLQQFIPYDHIVVESDPNNSRVCFGFPRIGSPTVEEGMNRSFYLLWSFMYKRRAWFLEEASHEVNSGIKSYNYQFNSLSNLNNVLFTTGVTTWQTWITSGIKWSELDVTWESLLFFDSRPSVLLYGVYFLPNETDLYKLSNFYYRSLSSGKDILRGELTVDSTTYDPVEHVVKSVLITPDFDFKEPNLEKTYNRLSVRLESLAEENISLLIENSLDGGDNWKNLGTLRIRSGQREGKIDFRVTGSVARFCITQNFEQQTYKIEEYVLRVLIRGDEVDISQ